MASGRASQSHRSEAGQAKEDRGQKPPNGCPDHPVVVDMCTIKATFVSKFGWINNLVLTGFATPAAAIYKSSKWGMV
jgi:hypothetical protein